MHYTLEQLKAMSNEQLFEHWREAKFPFESLPTCGNCLTDHVVNRSLYLIECAYGHAALTAASLQINDWAEDEVTGTKLREHLEELYALRLFYDHLYPQPAAAEQAELPSGFAAQSDSSVGSIALPLSEFLAVKTETR